MLEHVGRIVAAVGVPVTADLEAGYDDVADDGPRGAVEAGRSAATSRTRWAASCSASTRPRTGRRRAGRGARGTFVLNARTDTFFGGATGDVFAETVERAVRYVEAGADCVFVPGVNDEDTIRRLAAAIPAPLNLVAGLANLIDAPTLFSLGVKRVSLGGSLARAALSSWSAPAGSCSTRHPRLPRRRHQLRRPAAPVRAGDRRPRRPRQDRPGGVRRAGDARRRVAAAGAGGLGRPGRRRGRLRRGVRDRAQPAPRRAGVRRGGARRAGGGGGGPGGLPLGRVAVRPRDAAPPRQGRLGGPGPPVRAGVDDPAAGRLPAEPRPDRPGARCRTTSTRSSASRPRRRGRGRRDRADRGRPRRRDLRAGLAGRHRAELAAEAGVTASGPTSGRTAGWARCSPTTTGTGCPSAPARWRCCSARGARFAHEGPARAGRQRDDQRRRPGPARGPDRRRARSRWRRSRTCWRTTSRS